MKGRVIAKRIEKSVTVIVERQSIHPLYKKAFKRSKKYLVDDPVGVKEGDLVEIIKVAPVSKKKQFRIVKVLGKQMDEITEEKLKEQAKVVIEEAMPEVSVKSVDQNVSGSEEKQETDTPKHRSTEKPKKKEKK